MRYEDEMRNVPFKYRIPDVRSKKFKYIIEIDGSFHEKEGIKEKDDKRDVFFRNKGYTVFRIKHNDLNGLIEVRRRVLRIRKEVNHKDKLL